MKIFNLISWIGFIVAGIIMVCGIIDFLRGGGLFGLKHSSTFFTVANSVMLVSLFFKFFLGEKD